MTPSRTVAARPGPVVPRPSVDVEYRADRPAPYRARLRWTDPATGRRSSISRSKDSPAQAQAWAALLVEAAEGGLDPALVTKWLALLADATRGTLDPALSTAPLAEYGGANMGLILRGLQTTTHPVYLEGWRLRVVPSLGHLPPQLITPGAVDRAVHAWIADGDKISVIKNALAVLGRAMEQARRDGLIDINPTPIRGWQEEFQRAQDELDEPRRLALHDWDELSELAQALVAASHGRYPGWGHVVTAAAGTAARIGEVSGCRVRDIDSVEWIWTICRQSTPGPGGLLDKATKGKRARRVPIIAPLRPLIGTLLHAAGSDPMARLFKGPRGGRITTAILRDATHWDDVVSRLGHEHLRRHDLRHTGLTWMADAGIPLHVLQRIAGHGQLTTTQRYLHPDLRHIKQADVSLTAFLGQAQ